MELEEEKLPKSSSFLVVVVPRVIPVFKFPAGLAGACGCMAA